MSVRGHGPFAFQPCRVYLAFFWLQHGGLKDRGRWGHFGKSGPVVLAAFFKDAMGMTIW